MPVYNAEVSMLIRKTLTISVCADSESQIEKNIENLKKEIYEKYDPNLWLTDHEAYSQSNIDVYFIEEVEDQEEDVADIFISDIL